MYRLASHGILFGCDYGNYDVTSVPQQYIFYGKVPGSLSLSTCFAYRQHHATLLHLAKSLNHESGVNL